MKITSLLTGFIVILICGCSAIGTNTSSGIPDWLNKQIAEFQNTPLGNPPQSIWQYEYMGSIVYYVPPQCCDQFSQLYDSSGRLICAPDGGFSGRGDGKCPDFSKLRKNELLIWQDTRTK
jgi:hypothetical protein